MNKQIEEMAREMCHLSAECESCQICDEKYHGDGEPCYFQCVAKEIVNHSYRKASDVAREIFEELETVLCYKVHPIVDKDGLIHTIKSNEMYIRLEDFHAIKKKYESEGAEDGNGR